LRNEGRFFQGGEPLGPCHELAINTANLITRAGVPALSITEAIPDV
jgi:hypothetical protein